MGVGFKAGTQREVCLDARRFRARVGAACGWFCGTRGEGEGNDGFFLWGQSFGSMVLGKLFLNETLARAHWCWRINGRF